VPDKACEVRDVKKAVLLLRQESTKPEILIKRDNHHYAKNH
jgi:hypothetical protein